MASQKTEESEFWESLENTFGRKIPIDPQVRYVINMAIKESRNQDPEERAEVVDDAMYLAHDFVNVAFKDESDAEVAYVAVKTAKDFINEELESKGVKVPIDEETENETETKQTTDGNISPGDFLEQFPGIKKLERKGGPKEKPKEGKVNYVVNDGVINIYVNIIEKFVEVNKVKIFEDNDYQKLRDKGKYNLHSVSGLPTFRGSKHRSWNRITQSGK